MPYADIGLKTLKTVGVDGSDHVPNKVEEWVVLFNIEVILNVWCTRVVVLLVKCDDLLTPQKY